MFRSAAFRRPRGAGLVMRVMLAAAATFIFVVGWSLAAALTAPSGGTFTERMAEWARNNHLGAVVTFGEWLTYSKPAVGGKPQVSGLNEPGLRVKLIHRSHGLQPIVPSALTSPAGKPLPGEGTWRLVSTVHGVPAVYRTWLRVDSAHTSYVAGIVSMDQRLLKFYLRPGYEDPGPNFGEPLNIPAGARLGLLATFNGGFRVASARGGFYLNGHYDGQLVKGAAAAVYYRDGGLRIGTWGYGGLNLAPNVAGVRQNLRLIVDHGKIPASINQNVESNWGATLGGAYYVWRSGLGETADGRIIFVYGPSLAAQTLAALLQRAGCVSAMELDINPDWMSFMYYVPGSHPADPTPHNLLANQVQPPDRYYVTSNRDFTAVFAR